MKYKVKRKDSDRHGDSGSCHGDNADISTSLEANGNPPSLRRSTRKRSAPAKFVSKTKKSIGYWSVAEKEKLLKILDEVNRREIANLNTYRYPIKPIRKRIVSKSALEVKRYLEALECRAASLALSKMKAQPPLESWRYMSDQMTLLTGDESHRQLMKVCTLLALESTCKDSKSTSPVDDDGHDDATEATPVASSVATEPATRLPESAASTASTSEAPSGPGAPTSPPPSVGTPSGVPASAATIETTPAAPSSTAAPTCSPTTALTSTVASTVEAPAGALGDTPTSKTVAAPTSEMLQVSTAPTGTHAVGAPTETAPSSSAPDQGAGPSTQEVQSTEQGKSCGKEEVPDYASIYKYIGALMSGEVRELGPLESLVVLDCLKLVETHLKGRNNSRQQGFVQGRFLDILKNFYLSISAEDKTVQPAESGDEFGQPVTVSELLAAIGQSQTGSDPAGQSGAASQIHAAEAPPTSESNVAVETAVSQSEGRLVANGQSPAATVQISQSECSPSAPDPMASVDSAGPPAANKRAMQVSIGLGSLNPFNIPLSLLDIRKVD